MKRYISTATKSGNNLVGQVVTITDRNLKYFGNWAVIKEFDGDIYYAAVGDRGELIRLDRHDFNVSRDPSQMRAPKLPYTYNGHKPAYLSKRNMESMELSQVLLRFLGDRIPGMHDAYNGEGRDHISYSVRPICQAGVAYSDIDEAIDSALSEFNQTYGTNVTYEFPYRVSMIRVSFNQDGHDKLSSAS